MSGPSELAACAWGNIRLFASQVQTDSGRTQVVHELSSGDDHPVQNRGLRVRRVRVRLQFDDFPGQPSPRDAALALERAKDTGEVAIFRHPLLGSFTASIGDFNSEIDENSVISADAEFIKESRDVAVTPAGFASSSASGESLVSPRRPRMSSSRRSTSSRSPDPSLGGCCRVSRAAYRSPEHSHVALRSTTRSGCRHR